MQLFLSIIMISIDRIGYDYVEPVFSHDPHSLNI